MSYYVHYNEIEIISRFQITIGTHYMVEKKMGKNDSAISSLTQVCMCVCVGLELLQSYFIFLKF